MNLASAYQLSLFPDVWCCICGVPLKRSRGKIARNKHHYCSTCFRRNWTFEERFWSRVERRGPDDCWLWTGNVTSRGYGIICGRKDGRRCTRLAHRVSYELAYGALPASGVLDHRCDRPRCVNPAHLAPMTQRQNVLRGRGISAQNARKTHCKHGHAFEEANTYMYEDERKCKACRRESLRRWRAAKRAAEQVDPDTIQRAWSNASGACV